MISFIENLDEFREKIKGIDYSIMSLISKRMKLSKQVGNLKKEKNLPIRNYQVEKTVFNRISKFSKEFQLDAEFSKKIFEAILEQSVDVQLLDIKFGKKKNAGKNCLVIGGGGQMGNWFAKFLLSSGHSVELVDPSLQPQAGIYKSIPTNIRNYQYIIVCTPIETIPILIDKLLNLDTSALILEIGSLKSNLYQFYETIDRPLNHVISIHPMFGPDIEYLGERNLIICNYGNQENEILQMKNDLFEDTLLNLVSVELQEHDKFMLYTLGLSHFMNLSMGHILSKSPHDFNILLKFAGTTFKKQINTTTEVFSENPDLYYSIQNENNFKDELYSEINQSFRQLIKVINNNETEKFYEIMRKGKQYFRGEQIYD